MSSHRDGTRPDGFALAIGQIDLGNDRSPALRGKAPNFQVMAVFVGLYGLTRFLLSLLGSHSIGSVGAGTVAWIGYGLCLPLAFVVGKVVDHRFSGRRARAFSASLGLVGQFLSVLHGHTAIAPATLVVTVVAGVNVTGVLLTRYCPARAVGTGEPADPDAGAPGP